LKPVRRRGCPTNRRVENGQIFGPICCHSNARQEDLLLALKRKTRSLKILRMLDKKILAKKNKRRNRNILG
jgi:hypothetical protein